jgi:hypothetical protein
MEFRERVLYHQIHPLKLTTDWLSGLGAAVLLWQHRAGMALLVGLVPPVLVSALLLRFADLTSYRSSAFGRYVARFMSRRVEAGRLFGLLVFWSGAWWHRSALIAMGGLIILACWLYGLWFGSIA